MTLALGRAGDPVGEAPGGRAGGAQYPRARVHQVPAWWRDLVVTLTWLSLLVVVALWLSNHGVQNLSSQPLTSLGRLAGLISADLLLIQVLLMARIPMVERSYGQDDLARRHRLIGFTSFDLMLAHVVLIILGYASTARSGVLAMTWSLITTYPGMLLATAATGLLTMVVITSLRAARRALRYESWHLLHLYAYLGVGLSIPHEVWTGADFIASPLSRLYWWTLYAMAAGCLLVFRIGLPVWRSLRHRLVVTRVVREAPGVVSVHLRGHGLHRLPVAAGHFMNWRFLDGAGWSRSHPYSLSAAPRSDLLRITVKEAGDSSHRLRSLRPGTRAMFEGPYGRLTAAVRTRRRVTLIASGIGITPLRALLEELAYAPGEATLIYRASAPSDLVFKAELDELARRRGARVFYVIGPRIRGRRSWLPVSASHLSDAAALRELVPDIARHDVFVCGAPAWMDAVREAATAVGVPPERIHTERFGW